MKVCTDTCLFGAIVDTNKANTILDIGTGTGLLSLMLAQKSEAEIVAVEIDENAALQAKENFENSPWKNRLHVYKDSIQHFAKTTSKKFNLIICNPPFFTNHLKRPVKSQNVAFHSESLSFEELAESIVSLLDEEGNCWIMLPPHEAEIFADILKTKGLFQNKIYKVYARENEKLIRHICCYAFTKSSLIAHTVAIKNARNEYTITFSKLLEDYYLSPEEKQLIRE
jgi:tRNA1Val (adenine37-N6)-methyltransferase